MQNSEKTAPLIWLAFWGFIILYPVFFWYHVFIFYGLLTEEVYTIIRGLYGPACTLIMLLFIINFRHVIWHTKITHDWIFIIFFCYVLWCFIWSTVHVAFFPNEYTIEGAQKLFQSQILQTSNFLIGCFLVILDKKRKIPILLFAWLSIAAFCFYVFEPHHGSVYHSLVFNSELRLIRDNTMDYASYQGLARSFLMTSLLLIASTEHRILRFLLSSMSLVTLILIGARSDLMGFVSAIVIFELAHLYRYKIGVRKLLIGLSTFGISLLIATGLGKQFETVRALKFYDLNADLSVRARIDQINDAISVIAARPLTGDFAVHLKYGNHGDMPHNILSAWTMLGLPGFLLIGSLLAGGLYASFRAILVIKTQSTAWNHSLILGAMAFPQLIISKSAFVEWLPLFFGSVVAARTIALENKQLSPSEIRSTNK